MGDYLTKKENRNEPKREKKGKILEAIYSIEGSKMRPSYREYDEDQYAEKCYLKESGYVM